MTGQADIQPQTTMASGLAARPNAASIPAPVPEPVPDPIIEPLALMPEAPAPAIDPQAAAAIIVPDSEMEAGALMPDLSGPTTAAIPAPRPKPPSTSKTDMATGTSPAGGNGRITSSVTFRSAPGGSAIGTISGGTQVKVISCDLWCEIIHNDRKGFVYKTFLAR
ncbi:hypothetical protein ACFPLB_02110 [Aquamicrobium segne]|uniref:SH3b domain-containing protein n=1 Tax=Aquamicrobium segne TaxID=469547 RepID=A0ABW0GYD7_9HYPH